MRLQKNPYKNRRLKPISCKVACSESRVTLVPTFKKIGEIPMLEQLIGLLAALQGLDPMFVIAFMLCLHLLMKRRS
jgi:hypothetical protein